MWDARVGGRTLHFHLTGINDQNFVMRDEETGTWWQQVSGEGIAGPLAGRRLRQVVHDEISLAVFRRESPRGRVLRPDPRHVHDYAPADWEDRIARLPLVTPVHEADRLPPREIVVGLVAGGAARAIPQRELESAGALEDVVGGVPILVVLGEDGRSLRAFDRRVDGRTLDFARAPAGPWALDDRETGSRWDFTGTAVAGPLACRRLGKVAPLRDYWFDWEKYHPRTTVFPDPVAR